MENIKNTRTEHDLLGTRELPADALYGIQTLRGIENFSISKFKLQDYPLFIHGLAYTKLAAAKANNGGPFPNSLLFICYGIICRG